MKGIILAGGKASRLYPITKTICKQLLPVYDKPMIYYPLSVLMLGSIKDILILANPRDIPLFQDLLLDGSQLGLNITYSPQDKPRGIADSFLLAEDFIRTDPVCLILGDNLFYGNNLIQLVQKAARTKQGATLFSYYVKDPHRYGVIKFDQRMVPKAIIEKPKKPSSNWVITGLYFYDNDVIRIAKKLKPSKRGELEITDINNYYIRQGNARIVRLGRGYAWLDTGTHDSLIDASIFIRTIEERQGLKVGCLEEIALRMGLINRTQFKKLIGPPNTNYNHYLHDILENQ